MEMPSTETSGTEKLSVEVDFDAEPVNWDDVLAEFLLRYVRGKKAEDLLDTPKVFDKNDAEPIQDYGPDRLLTTTQP